MLRIHWLLRNPRKKGKTAIYFTVRYDGQVAQIFPKESIETSLWNNKDNSNRPKPIAINKPLEMRLIEFEALIRKVYKELAEKTIGIVSPKLLKSSVYAAMCPNKVANSEVVLKKLTVVEFFEKFIKDSETGVRLSPNETKIKDNSIKPYYSTMKHFMEFQKQNRKVYLFDDFNQELITNFNQYLIAFKVDELGKTLSRNAVGKYMQVLKTMLRYGQQLKLISPTLLLEVVLRVRREKSDNIFLDENDLAVMATNHYEGITDVVRSLFLISAYTGMRWGDLERLTQNQFEKQFQKYIEQVQGKTNGIVTLPIHPNIKKIYEKYGKTLPKCPCNQVFNKQLKIIAKTIPSLSQPFTKRTTRSNEKKTDRKERWNFVSAHTARRSFCSNLYLQGIDTEVIMSLSGHSTERSFRLYIAEAVRRKQADYINKRFYENNDDESAA